MKLVKMIGAAAVCTVMASSVGAATVVNGSFEDIGNGSFNGGGWNLFGGIPGWTGDPLVEIQSDKTLNSIDAQDGDNYAELDTNTDGSIFQDIFLTAGAYQLSFWYSPRVNDLNTSTNDMNYSVTAGGSLLSGDILGAPNPDFAFGEWTEVVSGFVLGADATITLTFGAQGGSHYPGCGNCGALLDNVSISAVPLPAGGALLVAGLGAFGLMRRRQGK